MKILFRSVISFLLFTTGLLAPLNAFAVVTASQPDGSVQKYLSDVFGNNGYPAFGNVATGTVIKTLNVGATYGGPINGFCNPIFIQNGYNIFSESFNKQFPPIPEKSVTADFHTVLDYATTTNGVGWTTNFAGYFLMGCNAGNSDWNFHPSYFDTTDHLQYEVCDDLASCQTYATSTPTPPPSNGISNVMFLPGIESSRLYTTGLLGFGENKLWEPDSLLGGDVSKLDLTNQNSINDVYAKKGDVISDMYNLGKYVLYKSFIANMDHLKSDGSIADWEPIAYDWRLDYQQLLTHGHETNDGKIYYNGTNAATSTDPYIIQELKRLAAGSHTGKVTIIAHSNGGLLAKALLMQPGISQYVDKVILVASPQLGTPQAMGALLNGFQSGFPETANLLFNDSDARTVGYGLPMAYNLLPSNAYIEQTHSSLITFDSSLSSWKQEYSDPFNPDAGIHSEDGLRSFMTDGTRNPQPISPDDLATPSAVNLALFNAAVDTHTQLDNWTPPPGVQLITISGWGYSTLSSLEYTKKINACSVQEFSTNCTTANDITFNPQVNIEGDGTVQEVSASWSNNAPSTNYWVDLSLNKYIGRTYDHGTIFEVPSVGILLNSLITNTPITALPTNIFTSKPVYDGSSPNTYFILHSPLTLGFTDSNGNYTGSTETTTVSYIPGVEYQRFGEVQWLSVPKGLAGQVIMHGVGSGSFTLDVQDVSGNTILATTTFAAVPSASSTVVTLAVNPAQSPTANSLVVDEDGNGTPDITLVPKLGGIVKYTPPKIPLTLTLNSATMLLGATVPPPAATLTGFVGSDTASSTVIGSAACSTTATRLSPVGIYPIVCTAGSLASQKYSFIANATGTLTVMYRWDGFSQPINDTALSVGLSTSVFKTGSTVPVKFQLKQYDGIAVKASTMPIWLTPQKGLAMSTAIDESVYADAGTTGTAFLWDVVSS